jgi:hypothetical protein
VIANDDFKMQPPNDEREFPSIIIKTYNSAMGDTDSFDQRLSYFILALKTKRYMAILFTLFFSSSIANSYIIHKQYHNTPKIFRLRHFIENLVFDLVPQFGLSSARDIPPIFKRRLAHWEQDRIRLNSQAIHAPFIEELPDAIRKSEHYRCECV